MRAVVLAAALLLALPAAAQAPFPPAAQAPTRGWTEEKCRRYAASWSEALERFGREGLGAEFLAGHEAFLASGCQTRGVCPRSRQEIAMADVMAFAAVNAGIAGSFLPFICRD